MHVVSAPTYAGGRIISNAPNLVAAPRPLIKNKGMVAIRRLPQASLVPVPTMVPRSVIHNTVDTEAEASRLIRDFTRELLLHGHY